MVGILLNLCFPIENSNDAYVMSGILTEPRLEVESTARPNRNVDQTYELAMINLDWGGR